MSKIIRPNYNKLATYESFLTAYYETGSMNGLLAAKIVKYISSKLPHCSFSGLNITKYGMTLIYSIPAYEPAFGHLYDVATDIKIEITPTSNTTLRVDIPGNSVNITVEQLLTKYIR